MVKFSFLPGEFIWASNGTHLLDDTNKAVVASQHTIVDIDPEKAEFVYNMVLSKRFSPEYQPMAKYMYIKQSTKKTDKFALLVDRGHLLEVREDYILDQDTYVLLQDVDWDNIPKKPVLTVKTVTKEVDVPVMIEVDELTVVKERLPNGNLKGVLCKTGNKVLAQKVETMEVFDENGKFLNVQEEIVTEKKLMTEEVIDDQGEPVLEPAFDDHGQPVMVPIYPVKYFDVEYKEVSKEDAVHTAYLLPVWKSSASASKYWAHCRNI
jgi:hypothetical protein